MQSYLPIVKKLKSNTLLGLREWLEKVIRTLPYLLQHLHVK